MFRLQRLEITGFKSFADYTEVLFTGNGITAVVGPNGCGKSNISDAISWVLGEQRAKALRGDEMKDLIFQGTAKRQPSGMAEVILHLVRTEDAYEDTDLVEIDETLSEYDENAVRLEDFDPPAAGAAEIAAAPHGNCPNYRTRNEWLRLSGPAKRNSFGVRHGRRGRRWRCPGDSARDGNRPGNPGSGRGECRHGYDDKKIWQTPLAPAARGTGFCAG